MHLLKITLSQFPVKKSVLGTRYHTCDRTCLSVLQGFLLPFIIFLCSYAGFLKGNCRGESVTAIDVGDVTNASAPAIVVVADVVAAAIIDASVVLGHCFSSMRESSMIIIFHIILKLNKKINFSKNLYQINAWPSFYKIKQRM
jgi:hypothetical protein